MGQLPAVPTTCPRCGAGIEGHHLATAPGPGECAYYAETYYGWRPPRPQRGLQLWLRRRFPWWWRW
ncbi:MAG: hypothetical protein ACREN4_09395 [Candidatus Dormibacteria bacterium]